MSLQFKYRGISHLPNPPIRIGITKKKIIIKPWAVTIALYSIGLSKIVSIAPNSNRIIKDKDVPTKPIQIPNKK